MSTDVAFSSSSGYPFLVKLYDVLHTLRGLWLMVLFNLVGVFAFLGAAQGTDVLLSIVEDSGDHFHLAPMLWLLAALFFWSVASEFCTRFLTYLSDNSGRSLAPNRVRFRKAVQNNVAKVFLFLPVLLTTGGVVKTWVQNGLDPHVPSYHLAFGLFIAVLLSVGVLLYFLYLKNGIVHVSRSYPRFAWLSISPRENQWVQKLYGILNDVRVDLPATLTVFQGPDLPRNLMLPSGVSLPDAFVAFPGNPVSDSETLRVWMFKIPLRFYRCLNRQFLVLLIVAVFFIGLFSFLPVKAYPWFGAASLICFALGCWQVVYTMLHFADKAQRVFPVRLFFLSLFLVTTFLNRDHPVRVLKPSGYSPVSLNEHFYRWYTALRNDSSPLKPSNDGKDSVPIVFVAAEGGALRTGAFTALVLAKLADRFPDFARHIYCYSGVSGGTLGCNYFNALYMRHRLDGSTLRYAEETKDYFKQDFLSAVTGKLVFAEIINYFIPFHVSRFDRAVALEEAWEEGWKGSPTERNWFATSFDSTRNPALPALFINTTEAESGLQCIWSNVRLDSFALKDKRDLYQQTRLNLLYSSAINLSTRFPLVSPGGALFYQDTVRKHFVDGGYFENTGTETLLEVMKRLDLKRFPVKPYVLQFNFGNQDSLVKNTSIKSFSEVMEIIGAIYNTRSGRSNLSRLYLQQFVDSLHGVFIPLYLNISTKQVPLNWVLSNAAVDRADAAIGKLIGPLGQNVPDSADKNELHRLFVYKPPGK